MRLTALLLGTGPLLWAQQDNLLVRLLYLMVVLALLWGAWLLLKTQMEKMKQEEALKEIRRAGGSYKVSGKKPRRWVVAVDLHGSLITNPGLAHLAGLSRLLHLDLSGTSISDAGLKSLRDLRKLQTLKLTSTKVTDAGLENLKGLKELQTLDLHYTNVTSAGVQDLWKALPNAKITH